MSSQGTGLPVIRSSVPLQVRAARLPSIRSPAVLPVMATRPAGNPASVRAISQGCQACWSSGHRACYQSGQPGLQAKYPTGMPPVMRPGGCHAAYQPLFAWHYFTQDNNQYVAVKEAYPVTILKTVTIVLFISLVSCKIPSQSPRPCLNLQK